MGHNRKSEDLIYLDEDFSIANMLEIKKELDSKILFSKSVCISFAKVKNIDSSGIQLLCSIKKSLEKANFEFTLYGPCQEHIRNQLEDLGLWAILKIENLDLDD